MNSFHIRLGLSVALGLLAAVCFVSSAGAQKDKAKGVWTDPNDATLPADFKLQGEYVGSVSGGGKLGAQVIALGNGAFQAVMLSSGLPGDGWDGKTKFLLDGKLEGSGATFQYATGKRKYLAQSPTEFSAVSKFPSGFVVNDYTATLTGDTMKGNADGKTFELKKAARKSPTLSAKPPAGAVVLFDGTNAGEWSRGRLDKENGILNTDGSDLLSKRKFTNYTLHLEFMLPYRPEARGQGRGNSGVYQVDLYEVQVLDSFGLDGKNNECGGVYSLAEPKVNMCLPPLTWQTYDIDFTSAVAEDGKKVKNARLTVRHNGVVIHDNLELKGVTGGARNEPEGTSGPIRLQGHGNPLQYRNIWIAEKK